MTDMLHRPTDNPFAGVHIPTRYAPGAAEDPYHLYRTGTLATWVPVIYYPAGDVGGGEGPIWLVEPYPAERADGTDGCDPIDADGGAGVAVVRGQALPRPRGTDLDADWIIPGLSRLEDTAYEVFVVDDKALMAAWCEAHAVAAALNNGRAKELGVHPEDVPVLVAAARGVLLGDSRSAGTPRQFRFALGAEENASYVPRHQMYRLMTGSYNVIEPVVSRDQDGVLTRYGLTHRGAGVLATIRAQYDGPRRCQVCGCTDKRGCPPQIAAAGCSWAAGDLCTSCQVTA